MKIVKIFRRTFSERFVSTLLGIWLLCEISGDVSEPTRLSGFFMSFSFFLVMSFFTLHTDVTENRSVIFSVERSDSPSAEFLASFLADPRDW